MINEFGFELVSCENGVVKFIVPSKFSLKEAFEIAQTLLTEDIVIEIIFNGLPLIIKEDSTFEDTEKVYKLIESENE